MNPLLPKPKYNVNNIRILSTTTYFYYYYLNNFLCGITYYMVYYILFIDSDTTNKSLEPWAKAHGQKQSILIQTMMMTNTKKKKFKKKNMKMKNTTIEQPQILIWY